MKTLLLVLLLALSVWGEDYRKFGEWAGGMATLSIGVEVRGDGSRGALVRFATSGPVKERRLSLAQWKVFSRAVKDAITASKALPEGESGPLTEVGGLGIRAVPAQAGRPVGVQLAAGDEASIVVHDFGGLTGALNDTTAALRTER